MLGSTVHEQRTGVRPADRHSRRPHGAAWLFLVLGLLLLSLPVRATAPLAITDTLPTTHLEPHTAWRCDPTGQLGLDAVRGLAFQPLGNRAVVFGFQPGACWFRFRLDNRGTRQLDLVLQVANPVLDRVELHAPGSGIEPLRTGDLEPFTSRPLATRFFTTLLQLAPGQQQDYFLRVSSSSSMNVPLVLSDPRHYVATHELVEWGTGIGFGIIAGLFLYHLFLWLAAREIVFRFYVLYVGAAFCYLLCMNGIAYRLWPQSPDWNSHAQPFFVMIMLASAAFFARDFLGGKERLRPGPDLALRAVGIIVGLLAWLQFALPPHVIYPLQAVLTFPVVGTILIAALSQLQSRHSDTRIFLASWMLLIIMALLLALQSLGLFQQVSLLVSLRGLELTFIIQQLLLALALADRLNSLKREQAEQQQAVLRAEAESAAKTEFLARMSHEIRTPLNALLGITELLDHTRLDGTQKSYVDTLGDSGQALLHVINDILDYSKISAGKVDLEQADFSLLDLLDECIRIFSLKAREKSLSLVCERSRDLPPFVRGDMARLRQILLNLLSNAIKFTEQGTVHLRASVDARDGDQVQVRFEIEDSGVGIPAETLPTLFTSFTQADTSTARQYGGTGLGLAISRQLVELMGGSISVSSAPGQGSIFRFTVRLGTATSAARSTRDTAGVENLTFPGRQVLVVEDNPVNQMVIQGFLQRLGVTARMAGSGTEALALLQQPDAPRFDVIFMDCEMPLMDGFEATRRLRQWEREQGRPAQVVVALTAHALPEHREQCLAAGMNDYLSKPLMLPRLAEKLREVLPPQAD